MAQLNVNSAGLKNSGGEEWNFRNRNPLQVTKHDPYMENYMLIGYNYMNNRHSYEQTSDNAVHQYVLDPCKYYNNEFVERNQCNDTELKQDGKEDSDDDASSSNSARVSNNNIKYNPNMLLQIELNTTDQPYDNPISTTRYVKNPVPTEAERQHKTFREIGTQCSGKIECTPSVESYLGIDPLTGNKLTLNNLTYHEINFHRLAKSLSETSVYKCSICDKEFLHKTYLDAHLRAHDGQKSKLRTCDYCDTSFTNKRKHYEHFKTHFNDESFHCSLCNASFVREMYLKEHVKLHSSLLYPDKANSKERIFPCSYCNRIYNNRSSVMFHLRHHTSEVVFRCDYCSKSFLNKSELNLHTRIHTGNKTHSCHLCQKLFLTTSNLKQHMRFHSGDKPYSCSDCDKCFSNKSNLVQHMKVHTGDKPHHCTFCEKSFSTTSNLTQHIRVHTGDKPYICSYCGKGFINNSNLSQHLKVHCPTPEGKPKRGRKPAAQQLVTQPPPTQTNEVKNTEMQSQPAENLHEEQPPTGILQYHQLHHLAQLAADTYGFTDGQKILVVEK